MNEEKLTEEDIIIALKQRAEEMLKNDYSRKIGDEEIYTIICEWEKTFDLYNKEKEKNKELEEYQHKVNEIMNFDEENLDTIRVSNNYIGLKNCVTQFRKQVEKLERDYIPKSKVREKIEELEKKQGKYEIDLTDIIILSNEINILQELLEE